MMLLVDDIVARGCTILPIERNVCNVCGFIRLTAAHSCGNGRFVGGYIHITATQTWRSNHTLFSIYSFILAMRLWLDMHASFTPFGGLLHVDGSDSLLIQRTWYIQLRTKLARKSQMHRAEVLERCKSANRKGVGWVCEKHFRAKLPTLYTALSDKCEN